MSATVIPGLMPRRRTSWRDSPAASRSFSPYQIGLTISATGRSGFGKASAGAPDGAHEVLGSAPHGTCGGEGKRNCNSRRAAKRGYELPPSDVDRHAPRPNWDHARCKLLTHRALSLGGAKAAVLGIACRDAVAPIKMMLPARARDPKALTRQAASTASGVGQTPQAAQAQRHSRTLARLHTAKIALRSTLGP